MKKILLLSAVISFQTAFSQVSMTGNKLEKNGQTYKMSKSNDVFSNPEAQKAFKKARTNNTVGQIFAISAGSLIGIGIIPALSGKTWNNLCIQGKCLLVRNADEAACFELP